MATLKLAKVFPPGEILRDELEERGWTQSVLADVMGRPEAAVSEIINGKRRISPEIAEDLAEALGTSAESWVRMEAIYRQRLAERAQPGIISRRARLYSKAPVKDMIRRGWIAPSDDINVLERRVCRFFRIPNLDDEPGLPLYAAKKSTPYDESPTPP